MKTLKGWLLCAKHYVLPHLSPQTSMAKRFKRNLNIRGGKLLAQGHPAKKWQSQGSRLILLTALAPLFAAAACPAGRMPTSRGTTRIPGGATYPALFWLVHFFQLFWQSCKGLSLLVTCGGMKCHDVCTLLSNGLAKMREREVYVCVYPYIDKANWAKCPLLTLSDGDRTIQLF